MDVVKVVGNVLLAEAKCEATSIVHMASVYRMYIILGNKLNSASSADVT